MDGGQPIGGAPLSSERLAKTLSWMVVAAILTSTAALVAGVGLLAKRQPAVSTPHSAEDEPSYDAEDIGEQPEERSLKDEPELEEPRWDNDGHSSPSTEAKSS